ncbi:mitochondrial import inner membrane translocase subunit Tim10 B isoform X2 [Chrysoperla carnea]|nr:mitochondrial import inner membrane translocase subunit Tim10 B isoform X2 [Chrysoperla carnea]
MREYNKLTEKCFFRCINSMSSRDLAQDEGHCVSSCVAKHLNASHKIMITYQKLQPLIMEKRQAEADAKIKEMLENQQKLEELQVNTNSDNTSSSTNLSDTPKQ